MSFGALVSRQSSSYHLSECEIRTIMDHAQQRTCTPWR